MPDQRLHNHPRDRCHQPKPTEVMYIRAKVLQDCGSIGVLQREAELNSEESEAHVPDLPEGEGWFWFHVHYSERKVRNQVSF